MPGAIILMKKGIKISKRTTRIVKNIIKNRGKILANLDNCIQIKELFDSKEIDILKMKNDNELSLIDQNLIYSIHVLQLWMNNSLFSEANTVEI